MRITSDQRALIESLQCVRLSSDADHLCLVDDFDNTQNSQIAETLKGEAYEEDENNSIAYYLVKDTEGSILFYFSLKCGLLYDNIIEATRLENQIKFYQSVRERLAESDLTADERHTLEVVLEKARTKKGIKREELALALHKRPENSSVENFFQGGMQHVGKTYAGIELVHFCANEHMREQWKQYHLPQKLGTIVFWQFVVPIVQQVMMHAGCEYFFLYAADFSEDQNLIQYYRVNLQFSTEQKHSFAIPVYDYGCTFMFQQTNTLNARREAFFSSFNPDVDAV